MRSSGVRDHSVKAAVQEADEPEVLESELGVAAVKDIVCSWVADREHRPAVEREESFLLIPPGLPFCSGNDQAWLVAAKRFVHQFDARLCGPRHCPYPGFERLDGFADGCICMPIRERCTGG